MKLKLKETFRDWFVVKEFGRVRYFNLSYLAIIGVPLLAEAYKAVYLISIEFPYTFKILYLSSLSYAIAIAIYQYFCPRIIKLYDTEQDYVTTVQKLYENAQPDRKYEIILANLLQTQHELKNKIEILHNEIKSSSEGEKRNRIEELNNLIDSVYPSCVQRFLVNQFQNAQHSYPIAIYCSGILYILGTVLLVYLIFLKAKLVLTI